MSERIEQLIKDYPRLKLEAQCLELQIKDFKGITETEIIESMNFSQPSGDHVQSSNISDKPASIALSYHERMEEANRDWYDFLTRKYMELSEELRFFECSLRAVHGTAGSVLCDMVLGGMTWNAIAEKNFISQRMVGKYRKAALKELSDLYKGRDEKLAAYLLS